MPPITKPAAEIDFLRRVDAKYRRGVTQDEIAKSEGLSGSSSLIGKVARLGFTFSRRGGLKLVDSLTGRPFEDWDESGDLKAAQEPAEAA